MNESIVTAHPTEFELRRYLERTLDADALLRVDDHIAVCDICRDFTASVAGVERRVAVLGDLNRPAGALMGSTKAATTLTPVKPLGVVVDQDQPVFQWTAGDAGAEYRVAIVDAMFNKVAESPWLPLATLWTP